MVGSSQAACKQRGLHALHLFAQVSSADVRRSRIQSSQAGLHPTSMSTQPASPYKPSPLSYGSPRTSQFKRPQSPLVSSPSTVHATTPTQSSLERHHNKSNSPASVVFSPATTLSQPATRAATVMSSNDPLSRLPATQLHAMRESFHLLASNNAGAITRADVADMLAQLGQDASPAALNQFFPPGQPQTLNLASYLQTLSTLLVPLSTADELGAAFEAFDVDDSGQVDVQELRQALRSVPAGGRKLTEREIDSVLDGFAGRRALAKGMGAGAANRGEVFRYQEFMASMLGGGKARQEVELIKG